MSKPTRHCHTCGWEWTLSGLPGRGDACLECRNDLRVCLNCISFDARSAYQCKDRRAEPVVDKHLANFCEYFDFIKRPWTGKGEPANRQEAARDALRRLLD